jgi:hypothetical protein
MITDEGRRKIGKAIYTEALSDRRGFRSDQIGIPDDDHEVWSEIYDDLARAALTAVLPMIRDEVLEEAAKVAEAPTDKPARCREDIAEAIRAMKGTSHDNG